MQILARLEEDNLLLFQAESLKLPQENGLATEIHEVLSPCSYVDRGHCFRSAMPAQKCALFIFPLIFPDHKA